MIEDVTIWGSDDNGIMAAISDGTIRNCYITNCDGRGITWAQCKVVVENCEIYDVYDGVYAGTGAAPVYTSGIVDNCRIITTGRDGITISGNDIVNVEVTENTVESTTRYGIRVGDMSATTGQYHVIEDNHVYNTGSVGISVDGTTKNHIKIKGNSVVETVADSGIRVRGLSMHIEDNIVESCYRNGIIIDRNENTTVTGNTCANNHQGAEGATWSSGILLWSQVATECEKNVVANNLCYDDQGVGATQTVGIWSIGGKNTVIESNSCVDNTDAQIRLDSEADDNAVIDNYLEGGDYGVRIDDANCDRTTVKGNEFNTNAIAALLDNGTDTITHWFFSPVRDPNHVLGRHPTVDMPVDTDTNAYGQILVPLEFQELVTCHVIVSPAGAGDLVWTVNTDYGKICAAEDYNANSDVGGATDTLLDVDLACLDISGALDTPAIAGGDLVGVDFMRDGDNVLDTIAGSVYFMGIRMRYV